MSHAHLSVRHLLQQLEKNRSLRLRGLQIPDWLQQFVAGAAELFEPDTDTARAGFLCTCLPDGWTVTLFLGVTEIVGGAADGARWPSGFRINLEGLRNQFDRIDRVVWRAFPVGCRSNATVVDEAAVIMEGVVDGNSLRVHIPLRPPGDVGPGLLQDADGHVAPAP